MFWDWFHLKNIAKDNEFVETEGFDKIVDYLFIREYELHVHDVVIDFFTHEMISDINVLDAGIKLSVLDEGNCALIVVEDYNDLRVRVSKPQKLIKESFQSNNFFDNQRLIDILDFASE